MSSDTCTNPHRASTLVDADTAARVWANTIRRPAARARATSYTSRQAYDLLAEGFGLGTHGPLIVALRLPGPGGQPAAASLRADLARQQDMSSVAPPDYNQAKTAAVLTIIPRTSAQDARTAALVQHLRQVTVPRATADTGISALIGGQTAASIDISARTRWSPPAVRCPGPTPRAPAWRDSYYARSSRVVRLTLMITLPGRRAAC